VIEIDFWQCSDFDSDFDFDFDELCPTLGVPREQPPICRFEIMKIFQRTKWPWLSFDHGLHEDEWMSRLQVNLKRTCRERSTSCGRNQPSVDLKAWLSSCGSVPSNLKEVSTWNHSLAMAGNVGAKIRCLLDMFWTFADSAQLPRTPKGGYRGNPGCEKLFGWAMLGRLAHRRCACRTCTGIWQRFGLLHQWDES